MKTVCLIAASLAFVAPALAEDPLPIQPTLAPIAFLAGSCWQGTFPGSKATDTHCFEPMLSGRFMRDRHIVEGSGRPYAGENVYRWDARAKVVSYDYFASDGGYSHGVVTATGETLAFADEYTGPDGAPMKLRSTWARDGNDAFTAKAERWADGKWQEVWTMRFQRTVRSG